MSNPPEKSKGAKQPARRRGSATAIGAYVPAIARPAFEAHGFPSASILSDWPEIIGPEFANISTPERLVWPRNAEPLETDSAGRNVRRPHRRSGATLYVRVEGPRALEVQHMEYQLLERINIYFGYRAVAELRLVQGPVRRDMTHETPIPGTSDEEPDLDDRIEDESLRAALSRLGARTGG